MSQDVESYRFGQFEVDRRTGELRKQGIRLRLRGRPVDILLALVARPGELVTRDELRARLWPADTYVDFDHGLHSAMNRLRDSLGDSADNPRFIETLPRKGYRFIAPVTAVGADPVKAPLQRGTVPVAVTPPTPTPQSPRSSEPADVAAAAPIPPPPTHAPADARRRPGLIGIVLTVAALLVVSLLVSTLTGGGERPADPMTIVVVPFDNLSGDPTQEYFSDGFTEEMIAELGMIGPDRLAVIGRTTSMLYKGARKSIGDIGREVGAEYLLSGSVRRGDSRLRITAQLVDTRTMANLWAESYDRDVGDVLAVQQEVAREIAASLAVALAPRTGGDLEPHTPSLAAYELYMKGRAFREQATEEGARLAIDHYERAIALEPNYAAAHAAVADAYRLLGAPGWEVDRPAMLLARAQAAAERALALDSHSPQARAVLAMIKFNFEWDLAGAEREIREALRLNPSFAQAHQYHSGILMCLGRMDDAIAAARRAVELDPLAPTATTSLGVRHYYAGHVEDARKQFLQTLASTPGFAVAHWGLAQLNRVERRFDEQIEQLRIAVQLSGNSAYMRAHLAYGYAVAGDRARAESLMHELEAEGSRGYVAPYHLALIAVGLGDYATTMRWLERAYDDRSGWLVFLPVEPEFDGMRSRPEFQQLLSRITPQPRHTSATR
jgi:TolB-like protein/DNA-binding winged helix-turn-helix (wHTH) protein/tetratricopeptide (TPR) repeat protein